MDGNDNATKPGAGATKSRQKRRASRRDFGSIKDEGTPTNPSFSVRWPEGGRQRRKRGFKTRTEAAAFLARIRTALADGVLDAHRRADVTLASVADEWLKSHSAVRLRSHADNQERWKRLEDFFGRATPVGEVTVARILALRERLRQDGLANGTVNRYLALLRSIVNHAVITGALQVSPVRRFSRGAYLLPETRPKRAPPLATPEEAARLLRAVRKVAPGFYGLFAFMLFTGVRRGEAAGVRWADIDLARGLVTIRRSYDRPTKSGKERTVPIASELAAILVKLRMREQERGALVFPNPTTGEMLTPNARIGDILDAACEETRKSGGAIARMRIHDLRHAYASLWLMAGGSLADLQRNLGHSTPVLTSETYGHIAEDHRVREASRRLSFGLTGADDEETQVAGGAPRLGVHDGGRR